MASPDVKRTWLHALKLFPAIWIWSPIQSLVVVLVPGITVIITDWACQTFSISVSETNHEANVLNIVVILYSISLVIFGWVISIQYEETIEAPFFRNLPISRWGLVLLNSLKVISFTFVITLSLGFGLKIASADNTPYIILIQAYIIHLLAGGTTLTIISFSSPYLRTWSLDNKQCIYTLAGYGWMMAIIIPFASVDNVRNLDQIVMETPWSLYLLPSIMCTILSWMTAYGIILLPVVAQRPRKEQILHRNKPNLLQKDMLRLEPPGGVSFPFLLRSWGYRIISTIVLIVFICNFRNIDLVPLYSVIEPYMPIAGIVLIIVGVLLTIPIAIILMNSVLKIIFFIPFWHTLPIPDRWVPNFFAVGIYTITILMGIDWAIFDGSIENMMGVGMIPLGLQMSCTVLFIQNPSVWGRRQQNIEGFVEGMLFLSQFSFFILVPIMGSFGLILLTILLACVGTIYSYWAMHWMWKRY